MENYSIYWGETHDNVYSSPARSGGVMQPALERARSHLDFYAAAYYTAAAEAFEGSNDHLSHTFRSHPLVLEGWKQPDRIEREWREVQRATRTYNEPGAFVTFPGYEWQGNGSSGDHNVFYREEGPPVFRVDSLRELYERIRQLPALAIPHHTAYRTGVRGKDWSVFDEQLSPFAEIFSVHGCSETDEEWIGMRHNPHMGPGFHDGTYQAALDRGCRVGAICSTDNWGVMPGFYGRGRMACLASGLTRADLWEAFKRRRVYGVTGDRIEVDFTVDGAVMGSVIEAAGRRKIEVAVKGSDAIDRIEVLRNGRVIATHCHQGTWQLPQPGRKSRFKMRVECGWGPKPNEMPVRRNEWRGSVQMDCGRVRSVEPCWISPQRGLPQPGAAGCGFELVTSTADVYEPVQNAYVFEVEADPKERMAVVLNGLREDGSLLEFARRSREMWFRDECVRMLNEEAGIEPESPEREDIYHFVGFKAKLHRAVPEAAYTARFSIEDDEPLHSETNYRVRVEQRNGQRAWTSPVWVRTAGERD